jgi:hypothetical protein
MTPHTAWYTLRILKWLLWAAFLGYGFAFVLDRSSYLDPFGHLQLRVEVVMFGLPIAAIFVGFLEMMARERAGVSRTPPPSMR